MKTKIFGLDELSIEQVANMAKKGGRIEMTPDLKIIVQDEMGNIFDREEEKRIESDIN